MKDFEDYGIQCGIDRSCNLPMMSPVDELNDLWSPSLQVVLRLMYMGAFLDHFKREEEGGGGFGGVIRDDKGCCYAGRVSCCDGLAIL